MNFRLSKLFALIKLGTYVLIYNFNYIYFIENYNGTIFLVT